MSYIDSTVISNPSNIDSANFFTLAQTNRFYNPYGIVIGMKSYELDDILFYDKTGVKAQTGSGWFGNNNNIRQIVFKTKKIISRKNKIDFNVASPFIIKSSNNYNTRYDLYIPISDLPKFEISYKKSYLFIKRYADIGLPNSNENYVRTIMKYLNNGSNAEEELRTAIKSLDDYDIAKKSDEEFNSSIQKIIELRQKMKEAYESDKNYTVDDWKKEVGIE